LVYHILAKVALKQKELGEITVNRIHLLKSREINVILVSTPTHKSYYRNIDPELTKIIENTLSPILTQYMIKFYDYSKDNRFVDDDFYNCDHLNVIGADKFSRILDNEVLNEIKGR